MRITKDRSKNVTACGEREVEGQKSVSNDTNKEKHHVGGIPFLREKLLVKTKKNGSRNIVEVQQGNCSVRARVEKNMMLVIIIINY